MPLSLRALALNESQRLEISTASTYSKCITNEVNILSMYCKYNNNNTL